MPKMDGYETAKRLRQIEGLSGARIVGLSGDNPSGAQLAAAGIDASLLKPANITQILDAIRAGQPV
jgi:CheY-like chemotaxis protein